MGIGRAKAKGHMWEGEKDCEWGGEYRRQLWEGIVAAEQGRESGQLGRPLAEGQKGTPEGN